MRAVLVSGGAGFIGSHTCKALRSAGFLPVSFDNLSRGHRHAVRWGPLHVGDLLDQGALAAAFAQYQPVAVVHCAGLAYVAESLAQPLEYYRVNVQGTLNLVAAAQQAGCRNVVFSSTCAIYGAQSQTPLAETQAAAPLNPYAHSKQMAEQILVDAGRAHGSHWTILRYFNASGADPDGEIGEEHDPEPHLIPRALLTAARRLPVLVIQGDDYPTPDGTCIRDYVHVSDLADAHTMALGRLLAGGQSDQFNLGNGVGFSVREVVSAASRVTGRQIPVHIGPRRGGDPAILIADITKVARDLGWRPRRPSLDQQIGDAWRWFSRQDMAVGTATASAGA